MSDMADMAMTGSTSDPRPTPEPPPAGSARAEVTIDPRRQQLIGVRTAPVERRALTQSIRAVGTVRYDETRLADVNVKVDGWIEELYVDYTGQFIEAGQPLFTLYSPAVLTTQQEYLLALQSRDQLRESQIADARVYADRLVDAARQRLALWDLPPDAVQALEDGRDPSRALPFRSPVSGFVIEKRAIQGQHVSAGTSLYTVADLREVWVEADLYEEELSLVSEGARATVTVAAYPGEQVQGRVRFAFPNPDGRLKPGMYANVALDTTLGEGVVVPTNALLDSGDQQHVFVSQGDGYFEPRPVVVGRRMSDAVQILDGLDGGEIVATSATFFIDSESQLRAALQGFEAVPRAADGGSARERLDISFRSDPDPPRSGENALEVAVLDPTGQPVTDAEVAVVFYMAPMPTMNMPAMQTGAALSHQGAGVYGGQGEVMMAGRWDVAVVPLTVPLLFTIGSEFMPPLYEGSMLYMPTAPPGLSVGEATRLLQVQDKLLRQFPEVERVFGTVGRATTSTVNTPMGMVNTTVTLKPKAEWRPGLTTEALQGEMDTALQFPGFPNVWTQPIRNRLDMLLTGVKTPIGIKIFGADLAVIQRVGEDIERTLQDVPGTRSVYAERVNQGYFTDIEVDRLTIARHGLTIEAVQDVIQSALGGQNVPIMGSTGIGSDVMKPMAAPIIGGMVTSTVHVLIITPVIFFLMKRRALRRGTLAASAE